MRTIGRASCSNAGHSSFLLFASSSASPPALFPYKHVPSIQLEGLGVRCKLLQKVQVQAALELRHLLGLTIAATVMTILHEYKRIYQSKLTFYFGIGKLTWIYEGAGRTHPPPLNVWIRYWFGLRSTILKISSVCRVSFLVSKLCTSARHVNLAHRPVARI